MSSRRCFKVKKAVKVVSYKGGKVTRRSKLNVPLQYSFGLSPSPVASAVHGNTSIDQCMTESDKLMNIDSPISENIAVNSVNKPKRGKLRIKKKVKAYRERKIRLGTAWLNLRQQLMSAQIESQALPTDQRCVIPLCEQNTCGRCIDCSPGHFMCDEHIKLVHAGGRTLHSPEIWKEDRYSLYEFKEMAIWNTTHNVDHGYTRDVVVINRNGQQHIIKFKFCCHEPEAVTLVRNGLWPSSPKEPQAAFEMNFMEQIKYLFLECRVSLKSICQAMQWAIPTLAQVYIKDIYRLLVGDSFAEYRFLLHMLNIFGNKNPLLGNDVQCPACPKENGNIYVSMDALFGCVRKMSAGTSCRPANHDETLFIKQDKVDSFLKSYNTKSSSKAQITNPHIQNSELHVPEEEGAFLTNEGEMEECQQDQDDVTSEAEENLEEGDALEILLSILHEEYGNDDSDFEDSDSDEVGEDPL